MPIASIITTPRGPNRYKMKSTKVQPHSVKYIPNSEYRVGEATITVTELVGGHGSQATNDIKINHRLTKHIRAIKYVQWVEPQTDSWPLICSDPDSFLCQLYGPPQE